MNVWTSVGAAAGLAVAAFLATACSLALDAADVASTGDDSTDDDTTWFTDLPAAW